MERRAGCYGAKSQTGEYLANAMVCLFIGVLGRYDYLGHYAPITPAAVLAVCITSADRMAVPPSLAGPTRRSVQSKQCRRSHRVKNCWRSLELAPATLQDLSRLLVEE